MDKIKERFRNDPVFAVTATVIVAYAAAVVLKGVAKLVESSAYAYRASKL